MTAEDRMEDLVDAIERDERYETSERRYISVYRRNRCYGGPEEGGWWYDVVEYKGSICCISETEAQKVLAEKVKEVQEQNQEEAPDRWQAMADLPDEETAYHPEGYIPRGWGDGGELFVCIEDTPGAQDNSREPTPHYE